MCRELLGITKKDDIMASEQGGMYVTSYEAKFHDLSRYDMQFVTK